MSPGGDLVSFAIPVFFRGDIFSITYREIFLFIFLLLGNTHCRNRYHSHPVDCFLSGFPKRKKRKGGNYFFPFEGLRSPDLNPIHRGGEKMDHGNGKRYYMIVCFIIVFLGATIFASRAFAFNSFLTEFKTFYSIANGTRLDTCGVCHFNFNGGGSRNPYGQAYTGSSSAINSSNSDGDGSPNGTEASSGFFPGYNCTNYSQASNVPASLTLANFVDPSNVGCVVSNPVPALTSLSPSSAAAGSGAFTLTVNGTGVVSGSGGRWDGARRHAHAARPPPRAPPPPHRPRSPPPPA